MFIDTHVHLNDDALLSHIDEVISDALENNVQKMIVIGWDKESSLKAIEFAEKYDFCYAMIGFHPCNIKGITEADYEWLEEAGKHDKVVGIGEIGFDFHWDTTSKEEQIPAFIRQIEIAKRLHKPISVHSRDAAQITFDTIKSLSDENLSGVIHSYSGSSELAKEYVKLGFVLGISGPVTFKNGRTMKETVHDIPLEYIVTETDSPYLTPTPYRGKENGPKYIPLIAQEIADIKEISIKDVQNQIEKNVRRVWNI